MESSARESLQKKCSSNFKIQKSGSKCRTFLLSFPWNYRKLVFVIDFHKTHIFQIEIFAYPIAHPWKNIVNKVY